MLSFSPDPFSHRSPSPLVRPLSHSIGVLLDGKLPRLPARLRCEMSTAGFDDDALVLAATAAAAAAAAASILYSIVVCVCWFFFLFFFLMGTHFCDSRTLCRLHVVLVPLFAMAFIHITSVHTDSRNSCELW